ncbi:MAG TPA: NCS2 family permease [Candidatus Acidoferrales bacterium]|nr:NCS2 family permease [Candidatus Acidoferrales bacterium]
MLERLRAYFEFETHGTTFRRETVAGVTTFVTMSYIIVVNPAILSTAGIPVGPSMVATILTAIFGTLLMGFYARRPFAVAPYMGENAFIAFTVVQLLGYTWQAALAAMFLAGVLFIVLTVARVWPWLVNGIPPCLRYSFAVGIGLFLTFIGLNQTGIVRLGVEGAPVRLGDIASAAVLVSLLGFLVIIGLMILRMRGGILIGILVTTLVAYLVGVAEAPQGWVSLPPSLAPILWKLDFSALWSVGFLAVVLTIFILAFVDTMGTLIGVSVRAGLLDAQGRLPQIERPILADALATTFAAAVGTTTSGAYIESATGIEAGGRTGFTAVVTGLLFFLALFFAPFVTAVPAQAYGPALMVVGVLMVEPITRINFKDFTELVPAFATIALMSFTFNIAVGMTVGFLLYPFCKLVARRGRDIPSGLWVLSALSLLFYIFYPYH